MASTRHSLLAAFVATTVLGLPYPVAANDPDASDPPRTSGPLVGLSMPCEDNGPAGPGEAKGQSCSWFYDLAPAETNLGEDFSAYWIQMEIDPGKGWCAKKLTFELSAPSDGRIVSAAPDRGRRIAKGRVTTAELIVDAEGAAPVPGTVAQDVKPGRGRITVKMNEDHYMFRWRGNSPDKVMVAVGVQLSHGRLPPELVYSWQEGVGFATGTCREPTLRAARR